MVYGILRGFMEILNGFKKILNGLKVYLWDLAWFYEDFEWVYGIWRFLQILNGCLFYNEDFEWYGILSGFHEVFFFVVILDLWVRYLELFCRNFEWLMQVHLQLKCFCSHCLLRD